MLITTTQFFCSRCKLEYDPAAVVGGVIKATELSYNLTWFTHVDTSQIDKCKDGKINLCAGCTDSLIAWFQDNGITD